MQKNKFSFGDKLKTKFKKLNKGVIKPTKNWVSKNIFTRITIVIRKTFRDIYSFKKMIAMIIIMLILPLIYIFMPSPVDFGLISPFHAATVISIALAFPFFFWSLGLSYTVFIGISGSPLIADEISSGTMLILISKPISRIKIFLGKFIAVFLYGMLLSFIAVFVSGWIGVLVKSGNVDHFVSLIPFLIALYLYSLFILFLFTSITMALSTIFKKSRNASVGILLITIFSFLAFQLIRTLFSEGNFYAIFQLYHFDLGYHLGNVFILFIESLDAIPPSTSWQYIFGTLTGVYDVSNTPIDPDQNINLGGYSKTNYYLPVVSLLIWLLIAFLLLAFALISLKKREISV
ncbi:MAG: ABC transporter permease [Promethearchaeota archaeon]